MPERYGASCCPNGWESFCTEVVSTNPVAQWRAWYSVHATNCDSGGLLIQIVMTVVGVLCWDLLVDWFGSPWWMVAWLLV